MGIPEAADAPAPRNHATKFGLKAKAAANFPAEIVEMELGTVRLYHSGALSYGCMFNEGVALWKSAKTVNNRIIVRLSGCDLEKADHKLGYVAEILSAFEPFEFPNKSLFHILGPGTDSVSRHPR